MNSGLLKTVPGFEKQKEGKMKSLLCLLLSGISAALSAAPYLTGKTDKNPLFYKSGEKIIFRVSLRDNGNLVPGKVLRWKRTGDDGKTVTGEQKSDQELVVTTSSDSPGMVRLEVYAYDENRKNQKIRGFPRNREIRFDGGAAVDYQKIRAYPEVAGMREFWQKQITAAKSVPLQPSLIDVKAPDGIHSSQFSLAPLKGHRPATGFVSMPQGAGMKSLPIAIYYWGYGCHRISPFCGYVGRGGGQIVLSVSRHGLPQDQKPEFYRNFEKEHLKGYGFQNNDRPENCDFLPMLLRDLRVLEFAKTLPEWDGKTLEVFGGSMGAFQALAVASLANESVTRCEVTIPWMTHTAGATKQGRLGGWLPKYTDALSFFDTVNFADDIRCPVSLSIGLGDYICPPSGQFALFHRLKKNVVLRAYQNMEHGQCYQPGNCVYVLNKDERGIVSSYTAESRFGFTPEILFESELDCASDYLNWPYWPEFARNVIRDDLPFLEVSRKTGAKKRCFVEKSLEKEFVERMKGKSIIGTIQINADDPENGFFEILFSDRKNKMKTVQGKRSGSSLIFSCHVPGDCQRIVLRFGQKSDVEKPVRFRHLLITEGTGRK